MAKREGQKEKLLRLLMLMYEKTDEDVGLTVAEIIDELCLYGISAERKSVYDDLQRLDELGFYIEKIPARPPRYALVGRAFEEAELKLLIDAVQSSKFITVERSRAIIDKLRRFAGVNSRKSLNRFVYVEGRTKTMNKASIYTIDQIHLAINSAKQITFKYFDYNVKKERVERHGGALYHVSPISLVWNSENYYLVGIDESTGQRKNFRTDKMLSVTLADEPVSEVARDSGFNSQDYTQLVFGMYAGEETLVTFECDESLASVIIDRFGSEPHFTKTSRGFRFSHRVMLSPNFYAWVMSFGSKMKIVSPENVKQQFTKELESALENYKTE